MDRETFARVGLVFFAVGLAWGAYNLAKKKPQKYAAFVLGFGVLLLVWTTRPGSDRAPLEDWTLLTLRQGGLWSLGAGLLAVMMGGRQRLEYLEDEREAKSRAGTAGATAAQLEAAAAHGAEVAIETVYNMPAGAGANIPLYNPQILGGGALTGTPADLVAPTGYQTPNQLLIGTPQAASLPFDGAAPSGASAANAQALARLEAMARDLAAAAAAASTPPPPTMITPHISGSTPGYTSPGDRVAASTRSTTGYPSPSPSPSPAPKSRNGGGGGSDIERARAYTLADPRFKGQSPLSSSR